MRSIPLGTVRAGETIKALAEVEITNDLVTKDGGTNQFHDVATEVSLVLAASPTDTSGIEIAEAQTTVTPQVHHWTFESPGPGRVPAARRQAPEPGDASTQPREPDRMLDLPALSLPNPQQPRACGMDVDHNRGHLSVLRFGPPGVARPVRSRSRSPTSAARASRGLPADAPITYAGQ